MKEKVTREENPIGRFTNWLDNRKERNNAPKRF